MALIQEFFKLLGKSFFKSVEKQLKINSNAGQKYLKKGESLAQKKRYFEALEQLEKAYQYIPGNEKLRGLMDRILFIVIEPLINGKEAQRAKEILLKYSHLEINDATQSALNNLSWACYSIGEYEEALNYSLKGLELDEQDFYLYCNKGNSLLGLNKYEEAIEAFNLAIKYDEDNSTIPLFGKGICLFNLRKYEEAETLFKQYLTIKKNEEVYSYLIECLYTQGKYKENIQFIDSILENYSENSWYHYKKAISLFLLHSYHDAMESFDHLLFLEPSHAGAYYSKCRIYCRFRILDGAIQMLKKAVELDEGFREIALEDEYMEEFIKFDEVKQILLVDGVEKGA